MRSAKPAFPALVLKAGRSRENVGMAALPENQGFATSSGNAVGPSNASISPVLISIFSRVGTPLPSSASTRKRNFGATGLRSNRARSSQGYRTTRNRSRIGPIGPVEVRTRSISSE